MMNSAKWSSANSAEDRYLRDRRISLADLNQLRQWIESGPVAPEGDWYKDFGSFKLCGQGRLPKTFLLPGQAAKGSAI